MTSAVIVNDDCDEQEGLPVLLLIVTNNCCGHWWTIVVVDDDDDCDEHVLLFFMLGHKTSLFTEQSRCLWVVQLIVHIHFICVIQKVHWIAPMSWWDDILPNPPCGTCDWSGPWTMSISSSASDKNQNHWWLGLVLCLCCFVIIHNSDSGSTHVLVPLWQTCSEGCVKQNGVFSPLKAVV